MPAPDSPPPPILSYERPEKPRPPRWVYVIIGLYAALLVGVPCGLLAYLYWDHDRDLIAPALITSTVLLVCAAGLLLVPVSVGRRRPPKRIAVWVHVLICGMLLGLLVFGASMALAEFSDEKFENGWGYFVIPLAIWALWAGFFGFMTRSGDPLGLAAWMHRWLYAGSVLELLIAVPTHIVVRRRPDCCAGMATGFGICVGIAVMVLAFGPSVVFLYYRRWKQLQRQ